MLKDIAVTLEDLAGTLQRRYPHDKDASAALAEAQRLVDLLDRGGTGGPGDSALVQEWGRMLALA